MKDGPTSELDLAVRSRWQVKRRQRRFPALYVTQVLDQVNAERGLPEVIRTDNGPEFAGWTMQTWAAKNGVEPRIIQPGKPVQNACIESFNSRFRDECLSQHWFVSLSHMSSVIDNEREDCGTGGLGAQAGCPWGRYFLRCCEGC